MRNHNPCKAHGPNNHSFTSAGTNCLFSVWDENSIQGINKFLDQLIRILNKSMNKHHVATIAPFHLN